MGVANTVIHDLNEYQRILKEHPLVIVLFTSPSCSACLGADKKFNAVAEKYAGRVKSLLLDPSQTPRIDEVDGTPTLLVYEKGDRVEILHGIGAPDEQQNLLECVFSDYAP
ncbi:MULTISPECIES: thioredoxin family protein [Pseudomonas]|uniref:Thioredoxin 1 n=1 Tax=Pseudomonas salomonii TaxID=191391 RepID=A0A1H3SJR5_9PSED|nr:MULTISPECIES: thioredoxin family protein [Pseudomonas]NWF09782.1 thioredoxin family protein [Pseudomonas salomonii]CRM39011.1 thioredoxin 2 [Pseudomonas sp. 58 R 3]SDZ38212.1 thioredoxin 1 [Pseudomonas salomonii]